MPCTSGSLKHTWIGNAGATLPLLNKGNQLLNPGTKFTGETEDESEEEAVEKAGDASRDGALLGGGPWSVKRVRGVRTRDAGGWLAAQRAKDLEQLKRAMRGVRFCSLRLLDSLVVEADTERPTRTRD